MEEKKAYMNWVTLHLQSYKAGFLFWLKSHCQQPKWNLISYRLNAVSPSFFKHYLSQWTCKHLISACDLACQRAYLTHWVAICFRASQRTVLHKGECSLSSQVPSAPWDSGSIMISESRPLFQLLGETTHQSCCHTEGLGQAGEMGWQGPH